MSWFLGLTWLALGVIFAAGSGWESSTPAWFALGVSNFFFGVFLITNSIEKAGKK